MPYLLRPRLHFAGRFEADPSTVNNDADHYDTSRFKPEFTRRATPNALNGGWNPNGTGRFRLLGCAVTRACYGDGSDAVKSDEDPVVGMLLADAGDRVFAKMVDLDPLQQLASAIWGLKVRITDGDAQILSTDFLPAAFMDIWSRAPQPGDVGASAFYQSTLMKPQWSGAIRSRLLAELRKATGDSPLSIKFNVDGYIRDWDSARFGTGRIVGTIGPAQASEPSHFVAGHQLFPAGNDTPANAFVAVLDVARQKIVLDLGNALPTVSAGGQLADIGQLHLAIDRQDVATLPTYTEKGWCETTAGIVDLPVDRRLSEKEIDLAGSSPLALISVKNASQTVISREAQDGVYVRADEFVLRLSPGETVRTRIYATKFGYPLRAFSVVNNPDPFGLQPHGLVVQFPPEGLCFDRTITTDATGTATLKILGRDPGRPRPYVDGQVYGIRPRAAIGGQTKDFDFISVRLFCAVTANEDPTWYRDIEPIFLQFANLYPSMKSIIDLSSYDDVVKQAPLLRFVLSLPMENPNHMPVTRDLSPANRALILKWLDTTGNNGSPSLGASSKPLRALNIVAELPADEIALGGLHGKTEALRARAGDEFGDESR